MKSIAAIYKPKDRLYKNVSTLIKADLPINKKIQNLTVPRRASIATNAVGSLNAQLFAPTIKNKFCGFFRGTDSLAISNANLALGTANFTIEFWLYRSSSAQNGIFSTGSESDTGALGIMFSAAWSGSSVNKLTLDAAWVGNCTSNSNFSTNVWYHVAWVRTSVDSMSLYVNGYLDKTFTINSNYNFTRTAATIGKANYSHTPDGFDGYIADFRIVKNQAIYTSPFSNPISYLTPTENGGAFPSQRPIPSNVILMCLNNSSLTRDTSLSAQTITSTSSPLLIEFSASKTALGGLYATYFAGASHVKLSSSNSSINLSSGNYTIDLWFYRTREGGFNGSTLAHFNNGSNGGTHIWINQTNQLMIDDGINPQSAFATVISSYTWHHLAIVRNSTTTTAYLNGTSIGSNSYTPVTNNQVTIGSYNYQPQYFFGGYMANFRVVVGQALYTANFSVPFHLTTTSTNGGATPSTVPTPANVVLLTFQDPDQYFYFLDRSFTPKALTYGASFPETFYLGTEFIQEEKKTVSNQNDLFSVETLPLSSLTFGIAISSYFIPDKLISFSGANHTYIKSTDNKIFATGNNTLGSLGDGTFNNRDQFLEIPSLSNARMGSVGDAHSFVVKNDNTAWGVGRGEFGSIGNGTTTNRTTPIQVLTTTISAICGDNHTIFIRTDNSAWGTGWNNNGQLGITTGNVTGPFGDQINTAAAIPGMTNVRTASCGTFFTIFVKNDNTAWATGLNTNGQFGSVIDGYSTPTQIMTSVKSVVCGPASTFFIKTDNTLWASGYNAQGQLGLGSASENIWTPTQITSLSTSIKSIATGEYHTIFIKNDNTAWAAGGGGLFQLGNNSSNNVRTPVQIASDIDSATCGMYHTILKKIDGSILVVGSNLDGQLGTRSNFTSLTALTNTTNLFSLSGRLNYIPEYAGFFDVGSYITTPTNTGFTLPGDFTIECWWKTPTILPTSGQQNIWVLGNNASTGLLLYAPATANTLRFWSNNAILGTATTSTTLANSWYHLAAVRSGTTLTLYINGLPCITVLNNTTVFSTHASNGFSIGAAFDGTTFGTSNQPQYISNVRVIKGQAIYTGTFTPPTSPLTVISNGDATPSQIPNISNVSLIALQSSDVFLDTSSQPKVINRVGDVTMTSHQTASVVGKIPQSILSPWTNSNGYWSGFFDGASKLTVPFNLFLSNLGTNDFTIEAWIYRNSSAGFGIASVFSTWSATAGSVAYYFRVSSGNRLTIFANNNASVLTGTITILTNTWYHVAVTREAGTFRLFVNGVLDSSWSPAIFTMNSSAGLTIGSASDNTEYANGYISNLRISNGKALYTSAFTPSTIPLSIHTNGNALSATRTPESVVSMLALQDNRFVDSRFLYDWRESMFAGTFNGANYLSSSSSVSFDTGQFTIECWINPSAVQTGFVGNNDIVADFRHQYGPNNGWRLTYYSEGDYSGISFSSETAGGSSDSIYGTDKIIPNTWTHIAISRDANNIARIFYNGVLTASKTFTKNINGSASGLRVGAAEIDDLRFFFSGSISNLRIVKGQALYTQNFTPPLYNLTTSSNGDASPSEIPISSNVLLLMLQSSNILTDNSPTPKTFTAVGTSPTSASTLFSRASLTVAGTPKIQPFNPFTTFKIQKTKYNSGWFDASSYLTFQPNAGFDLSGDFTIEFWLNTSVFSLETASSRRLLSLGSNSSTAANLLQLLLFTTAASNIISVYTTSIILQGSITVADGGWHHVALARSGSNLRLYVDGVQSGSTTVTSQAFNAGSVSEIHIGKDSTSVSGRYNGYLANLRIVKGSAVYTGPFLPPIAPVTFDGITSIPSYTTLTNINTSFNSSQCGMLLNFEESGVFDSTGNTATATYFEARSSEAESKWNNRQALYFDGTNYITHTPNFNTNFGTRDFTVEAWIWPTISTGYAILDSRTSASTNWTLGNENSATRKLFWYNGTNASGTYIVGPTTTDICLSAWNHVMYTRSNNVGNLYCNGIRIATAADTTNYSTIPTLVYAGMSNNSGSFFNGYMDDIRITNGSARATGVTYTVPTRHAPTR